MDDKIRGQREVSQAVPLPVESVDNTSVVTAVAAETVTWFYVTSSAWASATGQAAATIVTGKMAFTGVLNSMKSALGCKRDTSLVFSAATRFSTLIDVDEEVFSEMVNMSPTDQKATISTFLTTNGQYCIDHRRGQIWGKALDIVADDTVAYSYASTVAGGGTGDSVNVIKVGSVAVPTAGADAVSNTRSDVPTSARISGFNGTTWDRIRTGITGVVTTVLGYINVMNVGRYNATALTLSDTNYVNAQVDVNGNQQVNQRTLQSGEDLSNNVMATSGRKLASATYSPLLFTNFGANTTLNVKASAGNVFSVSAYNTNAAARFIQIHNTATVPGGAAVPLIAHLVPAGAEVVLGEDFFSTAGLNFTTGIAFAMSTTLATYTAATAGEGFVEVHYL